MARGGVGCGSTVAKATRPQGAAKVAQGGGGDNDDGARGGVCRGGWGAILIVKLQNFHLKCKNHEYFHLKCKNHE
jgi:hypothetical protein